jgi:anti-sigma-K factor RskA
MTTNEDLHELLAAYALDALDADERRAFEEHLAGCEPCRADLAQLTGTVGALGLGFAVVGAAAAAAAAGLAIGLYAAFAGGSPKPELALPAPTAGRVTTVTASGFDSAPSGKVYEVWVIEGKTPRPAGFFPGGERQVVTLTRPAPVGSTIAVTLERAGGVKSPTPPVLTPTPVTA